jgi:uncharacterized protein (TIGR03083 family)
MARTDDRGTPSTTALALKTIQAIDRELTSFQAYANALAPADWTRGTVCTAWTVADAVGHVEMTNRFFATSIHNGLHGGPVVQWPKGMDAWIDEEVERRRGRDVTTVRAEFAASCRELMAVLAALQPDEFDRVIPHPKGTRPVWLYLLFCLDEVAVHQWDIRSPVDPAYRPLPETVDLLAWFRFNQAQRWLRPTSQQPADRSVVYRFVIAGTVHSLVLASRGGALTVQPDPVPAVDATIAFDPWALVRLTHGRLAFDAAVQSGEVHLIGDAELARLAGTLFFGETSG